MFGLRARYWSTEVLYGVPTLYWFTDEILVYWRALRCSNVIGFTDKILVYWRALRSSNVIWFSDEILVYWRALRSFDVIWFTDGILVFRRAFQSSGVIWFTDEICLLTWFTKFRRYWFTDEIWSTARCWSTDVLLVYWRDIYISISTVTFVFPTLHLVFWRFIGLRTRCLCPIVICPCSDVIFVFPTSEIFGLLTWYFSDVMSFPTWCGVLPKY